MKIVLKLIIFALLLVGCSQNNPAVKQQPLPIKNVEAPVEVVPILEDENEIIVEEDILPKEVINNDIGILFPSHSIGKYALEATNSISTYLINRNIPFNVNAYDIYVQNKNTIQKSIEQIKSDNITKVIAMITKDNLHFLSEIEDITSIQFYLPLIHKNDIKDLDVIKKLNVTFGAISYQKQFDKILEYSQSNKIVEFFDNSNLGKTLHSYLEDESIHYSKKINDNNGQYKYFLKDNRKLTDSLLFLNTPIVKSSILLSAITAEEVAFSIIASSQLNYTPLLFSLTQAHDRTKLIVANSIGNIPIELEEYVKFIGNDLKYSWVNYSTIIGVEFLLSGNILLFDDISIVDGQVDFPVKLYSVGRHSFNEIK